MNTYTYHIVYQIENKVNKKIYIGVHASNSLNDRYIGSGILISRAVKKYGRENFSRTILHCFENPKDAYDKEREIVNESFILREDTYNQALGGRGGYIGNYRKGKDNPMYGRKHSAETKEKISASMKGIRRSKQACENMSNAKKGVKRKVNKVTCPHCGFFGNPSMWHGDRCRSKK